MFLFLHKIVRHTVMVPICLLVLVSPCFAEQGFSIDSTTVKDDGLVVELRCPESVGTLAEKDLSIYVNGSPVEFSLPGNASTDADNRLTYVVVSVDASKSISRSLMPQIKKQVKQIIAGKTEQDVVALYRFNDDVVLLNNFTRSRAELENSLDSVARAGTKTLLYNALFDSIDRLQKAHGSDKTLIVFTDGKDEGSNIGADEIISLAKDAGIEVNFVAVKKFSANSIMAHIAESSNGKVWDITNVPDPLLKRISSLRNGSNLYTLRINRISLTQKNTTLDVRLRQGTKRYRAVESIISEPGKSIFSGNTKNLVMFVWVLIIVLSLILLGWYYFLKPNRYMDNNKSAFPREQDDCESQQADINPMQIPAFRTAWLLEKDETDHGKKFPINGDELTIGRSRDNSIILQDSSVSMSHARIRYINGEFYIFDLASEYGTLLNGKKLLRPKPLNDWDEIKLGRKKFIFRAPIV